jgi:hypothetical protein
VVRHVWVSGHPVQRGRRDHVGAVELWRKLGFEILAIVPGAFCDASAGYVGLHVMYRALP